MISGDVAVAKIPSMKIKASKSVILNLGPFQYGQLACKVKLTAKAFGLVSRDVA